MAGQSLQVKHRGAGEAQSNEHEWARAAQLRFNQSSYPALRRLRCRFDDGRLVIHGKVGSYFQKQLAQAALSDLRDVEIVNETEVAASCESPFSLSELV
ncbi:MAG: hypothetical protein ACUVTW_08450 [Thermogutta sp.]